MKAHQHPMQVRKPGRPPGSRDSKKRKKPAGWACKANDRGEFTVTVLSCPVDPEIGCELFCHGARFNFEDFVKTLCYGHFPDGMVVSVPRVYRLKIIDGPHAMEVHGSYLIGAGFVAHSARPVSSANSLRWEAQK